MGQQFYHFSLWKSISYPHTTIVIAQSLKGIVICPIFQCAGCVIRSSKPRFYYIFFDDTAVEFDHAHVTDLSQMSRFVLQQISVIMKISGSFDSNMAP